MKYAIVFTVGFALGYLFALWEFWSDRKVGE